MKIYVPHSKGFDYKSKLYLPIRQMELNDSHEIILPHELEDKASNTRDFYRSIDLVIAECSVTATGLGIELGWLYDDGVPIYCIYKEGYKLNGSAKSIAQDVYSYKDADEMIEVIEKIITHEIRKRNENKLVRRRI